MERIEDPGSLESVVGESGGLAGLLGADHDPAKLAPLEALLATIEGYGDHVTRLALTGIAPELERIDEAWERRRHESEQPGELLGQLVGLTSDRSRAAAAGRFFPEIVRRWSAEAVDTVWSGSDGVPTVDELDDPVGWAARVLLGDPFDPTP